MWHETTEISPPDSPVSASDMKDSQGSRRVSPIEEDPPGSMQAERNEPSRLRVSRRFSPKESIPSLSLPGGSKSELNTQKPSRATRWDVFSGEPTTNSTGKAAQVAPGRAPFQLQAAPKQPDSQGSGIRNWGRGQFQPIKKFAEAHSRLSKSEDTLPQPARERWKGHSGRLSMMGPVQQKERDGAKSRADQSKGRNQKENQAPSGTPASEIRPTVVTTITGGQPTGLTPLKPTFTFTHIDDHHPPAQARQSRNTTPPRLDLPRSTLDPSLADLQLKEQPPSHFGSTTCETTEAGSATDGRRDSMVENQSTENLNSIMSRDRPVPSGMVPGKKPTRKPTPSQAPDESTAKALPECPPEKLAETRVDALEARREALARRKTNIETIIHELTRVIQPSSIAPEMAVREEVKRTVASLNSELADVKREDHEIGIALFRAYKKRDEQGRYGGPTGLWVKRVTS